MNEKNGATSIGVRFFSVVAAVAVVLAAVAFFRSPSTHPWLQAAIGVAAGIVLIAVAELWIRVRYRVTANALDAAGIAVLYVTLDSMHAPLAISFVAMLVVSGGSELTQIGFSVAVGVLISAFVMASLLVPALTVLLGRATWWPGRTGTAKPVGTIVATSDRQPGPRGQLVDTPSR